MKKIILILSGIMLSYYMCAQQVSQPANQSFTISFTETQENIKQMCIIDMQGKIMLRQENLSDNTVNISNLPSGTYIVQVISKRGKEYTSKLVKE